MPPVAGELSSLDAAILAGGLGTRLRPVVSDCPKVLAPVRGRPFLSYLLDQLAAARIKSVVLCTGYLGDQIEATFGEFYRDMKLLYSCETFPHGTGGALKLALPLLESQSVLVMNGDSYFDINLSRFRDWHRARPARGTLALVEAPDTRRYGRVRVDERGAILSFEEKAAEGEPGCINGGIYLLSRSLLETIPGSRPVSLEREMFPAWTGQDLYGYQGRGRFLDIGTPESYLAAQQTLGKPPQAQPRAAEPDREA